jgi:hypothetical protein
MLRDDSPLTASAGDRMLPKCSTAKNRRLSLPSMGDHRAPIRRGIAGRRLWAGRFCFHATEPAFSLPLGGGDANFRRIGLLRHLARGHHVADRWRASMQWLRLPRWPGYRGPNGRCVGFANLKSVCGDPPETRCAREGVPKVEEPQCSGCGCKGGPGYRAQDGHCVGWQEIGRLCGSPPTTRCKAEGPNAGAEAAAKSEVEQIEARKQKGGTK